METIEDILKAQQNVKVLDIPVKNEIFIPIDLSDLRTNQINLNLDNAKDFEKFIEKYVKNCNATVAFGGYLEKRNLYRRSQNFNKNEESMRDIHLGMDLWINAGMSVLAALEGKIHSFKNNLGLGDYGPTIILEHQLEDQIFYTLYGHLSLESLEEKFEGKFVKKAEKIGELGTHEVNGDYAPHLHFQIIKDLHQKKGDYPGVCSKDDLHFFKENCPDPNLLLKISSAESIF